MIDRIRLPVLADGGATEMSRRSFMKTAAAGAALGSLTSCNVDEFLRSHFNELSKDDLARVLAGVERKNREMSSP